jgi:hypothetical protein
MILIEDLCQMGMFLYQQGMTGQNHFSSLIAASGKADLTGNVSLS